MQDADELGAGLERLSAAASANRATEVRAALTELVVGYRPAKEPELAGALSSYYPDGF